MDLTKPTPPPQNEIIAPIRPGYSPARKRNAKRVRSAFKKIAIFVLASAALTAGAVLWIQDLSRETVPTVAKPPQAQPAAKPALSKQTPPLDENGPSVVAPQTPAPAAEPPKASPQPDTEIAAALNRLLASAARNETAGNLAFALSDFQEALRIDAGSAEARSGMRRIKGRMVEAEYRKWMAAGILALDAGNYETAKSGLLKAKALKPESHEVQEALNQVETGLRLTRIEALRQKVLSAEKSEDWQTALDACEAALAVDPNLQFALQSKQRAATLHRLDTRTAYFLNQPDLLGSDVQLDSARRLLQDSRSAEPLGSRLSAQVERLEALVVVASTPVPVTLQSDNLTEVAVYRVGKLGRFTIRELNLRPGTYTVTGTRDGYRDVRQEVVVKAGPEPMRIAIICRDKV